MRRKRSWKNKILLLTRNPPPRALLIIYLYFIFQLLLRLIDWLRQELWFLLWSWSAMLCYYLLTSRQSMFLRLSVCPSVRPSVCPSVRLRDNSRTDRHRKLKLGTQSPWAKSLSGIAFGQDPRPLRGPLKGSKV